MGLILKSLAPYTGPYPVSTHDVELAPFPSRSRSEFSRARLVSNGQRALSLDSVLFTVFYPTSEDSDNRSKPMPWLERPLSVTARGYAKFLAKPKIVVQALVYAFGAGLHLATRGTDLPVVRLDKPAPVVVFSHGLSGNRTTYSQYCGELASRGYVVVAIEHRDGSGPVSIVKPDVEDPQSTERIVDYIKEGDIYYEDEQDRQPFIKFRGDQLEMRQAEIAQVLEILERVNRGETDDLERSNRRRRAVGDESTPSFRWKDLHGKLDLESNLTMAGHSFGGATTIQILRSNSKFRFHRGIALDPWADPIPPAKVELELDLSDDRDARKSSTSSTEDDRTTLVSTTTSDAKNKKDHEESLSDKGPGGNDQEASPSPAQPPSTQERGEEANEHGEREGISIPFLVINSEAFTLWKPHFYLVRDIVTSVRDRAASTWFFTILGSIHLSFSDLPLFLPSYLSPKAATTPASTSHTTIVDISVEFLDGAQQRRDGRLARNVAREGDEEYVNPNRGEGDKGPLIRGDGEDYARLHVKRNVSTQ